MEKEVVQYISLDLIDEPENAMRTDIDRDALHELADNIRKNGLINPITVRPKGDRFEIVAGHRRYLACGIARMVTIPCVVRVLDEHQTVSIMAAENIKRNDVDPVDEANFIVRMMQLYNYSISEMAEQIQKSDQYVRDRIAIGDMPDYMRDGIKSGKLKIGVALALSEIEPDSKREVWVNLAIRDGITQRTADYWLYQHKAGMLAGDPDPNEATPDAPGAEYRPIRFRCAIDGLEYAPSDTRAVTIAKANLWMLSELGKGLNSNGAATDFPPDQN